jgi:hypothetical protein
MRWHICGPSRREEKRQKPLFGPEPKEHREEKEEEKKSKGSSWFQVEKLRSTKIQWSDL